MRAFARYTAAVILLLLVLVVQVHAEPCTTPGCVKQADSGPIDLGEVREPRPEGGEANVYPDVVLSALDQINLIVQMVYREKFGTEPPVEFVSIEEVIYIPPTITNLPQDPPGTPPSHIPESLHIMLRGSDGEIYVFSSEFYEAFGLTDLSYVSDSGQVVLMGEDTYGMTGTTLADVWMALWGDDLPMDTPPTNWTWILYRIGDQKVPPSSIERRGPFPGPTPPPSAFPTPAATSTAQPTRVMTPTPRVTPRSTTTPRPTPRRGTPTPVATLTPGPTTGGGAGGSLEIRFLVNRPVAVTQDPERRGADILVIIRTQPAVFRWTETVQRCEYSDTPQPDWTGCDFDLDGDGQPDHPDDPQWRGVTEQVQRVAVVPDQVDFNTLRFSARLTDESRAWILGELRQKYPGATVRKPEWDLIRDRTANFRLIKNYIDGQKRHVVVFQAARVPFVDPGEYVITVSARTRGVWYNGQYSPPRVLQGSRVLKVWLLDTTLTK